MKVYLTLKASLEAAKRQCRVQLVGERLDSCLKFVERAQGRVERQKRIVEEAQQVLANYESQLAAGCKIWNDCVQKHTHVLFRHRHTTSRERNHRIAGVSLENGTNRWRRPILRLWKLSGILGPAGWQF